MPTHHRYGVAVAAIGTLSLASIALAQTTTPTVPSPDTMSTPTVLPIAVPQVYPAPLILEVDNSGKVLIRGVVQSSGAGFATISSWGGVWTIRTGALGVAIPSGPAGTNDLSQFVPGHFVGAAGSIASDQPLTIDATLVRDWTTNPFGTTAAGTSSGSFVPVLPPIQQDSVPDATLPAEATSSGSSDVPTSSLPFY